MLFVEPELLPGMLLPPPVEPEARGIVLAPPLPFIEPEPLLPSWSFIEPMLLLLPPLLPLLIEEPEAPDEEPMLPPPLPVEPEAPDEEPMPLPLPIVPVEPDEEPVLLPLPIEFEPSVAPLLVCAASGAAAIANAPKTLATKSAFMKLPSTENAP